MKQKEDDGRRTSGKSQSKVATRPRHSLADVERDFFIREILALDKINTLIQLPLVNAIFLLNLQKTAGISSSQASPSYHTTTFCSSAATSSTLMRTKIDQPRIAEFQGIYDKEREEGNKHTKKSLTTAGYVSRASLQLTRSSSTINGARNNWSVKRKAENLDPLKCNGWGTVFAQNRFELIPRQ